MLHILHLRRAAPVLITGLALCTLPAFAQVAPVRAQGTPAGRTANPYNHPHQEPCWQVAGISKSAMERRRTISENTRSQVQSVCADSSLTVTQKQQKIRQIRDQARQEEESLVTPSQLQALHACQAERGHTGTGHAGGGHGGSGPCGDLPGHSAPETESGSSPQP